mgnify:CR=1 FL=1
MISSDDFAVIANHRVFDMELYMLDKGSKHREPKEFFINLEYEEVEALADFFNDVVADLKKRNKLK